MIGHGYSATERGGKLTVRDVPIFVECERGDLVFDGAWIDAAVAKAMQRQQEGYYPPLHVRHHEPGVAPGDIVAGGYFRISGVRKITFKGQPRKAVMADLIFTDPGVAELVKQNRLPYRSVEIFDVEDPGIDSLAVLDHEAPFLELPMLTLSSIDGGYVADATFSYESAGGVARVVCFRRAANAHLLFREEDMADEDKKGDDTENMEAGEGGMDVTAVCKAIESGEISVADFDAILAAIAAKQGEPAEAEEAADETAAPAAVPGGESMRASSAATAANFAKLAGENRILQGRIEAMEQERRRDTDVSAAMKRLEGKPLGSDLRESLVAFHRDNGSKAFAAHVAMLDKAVGVLPETLPASGSSRDTSPSKVVGKYLDLGADAMDHAARFSAEWRELHDAGHIRKSEDRYVAVAMARAGFNTPTSN